MQDLTISLFQADLAWEDIERNLAYFDRKIDGLSRHPDLIVLPEMFATGFSVDSGKCAKDSDGPIFSWISRKATERQCAITGSMLFTEQGKLYNRLVFMWPDGHYETYDKRHLFRFGNEHAHFTPGSKRLIAELNGWKLRPLVCYDLRFPVWSKNTYNNHNFEYDCLIYVANWPDARSHHWKTLLLARAIENMSYCVGVNRIGTDGKGTYHGGDSLVVDPKGKLLAEIEKYTEGSATVVLRAEELLKYRESFNVAQDWDSFSVK